MPLVPWDVPARPDVTYIIEQQSACAWYRCRVPGEALKARGYRVGYSKATVPVSRITVFLRPSRPDVLRVIREITAAGRIAVVDLDDDLWSVARANPAYAGWNGRGGARNLRALEECIRASSFVTTTTPALAKVVGQLNADVRILPNMLLGSDWPKPPEPNGKCVIGWAGSNTHTDDLTQLRGVLETLIDRHPQVRVELAGLREFPFGEHERLSILGLVPLEKYPALVSRFDVGVAPVTDTRFNRAKSDLKYLEYAACGIPCVVSAGETYASVAHGTTGFRAKNGKEWLRHLSTLIEDAAMRHEMGKAARAYAETRFAETNVEMWERAYGL